MNTPSLYIRNESHGLTWISDGIDIYIRAMNYPPSMISGRESVWIQHTRRVGFCALNAYDQDKLIGVCYGFTGGNIANSSQTPTWWCEQVRYGLLQQNYPPVKVQELTRNYFELSELHVDPHYQGQGVGHALVSAMITSIEEPKILLSTPEVSGEDNRAWKLYRRYGFEDVLRNFLFPGDPRPFGVLGLSVWS